MAVAAIQSISSCWVGFHSCWDLSYPKGYWENPGSATEGHQRLTLPISFFYSEQVKHVGVFYRKTPITYISICVDIIEDNKQAGISLLK